MRILVLGREGQLGRALARTCSSAEGIESTVLGRGELDLADPEAAARALDGQDRPDWLINAAAYTAVDRAEEEEELALRINGESPGRLARRCRELGIRMLQVSTDFVFDGRATAPYREDAAPAPASAYGRTKLAGERAVHAEQPEALVVRTSWVFGAGHNFVRTMLRLAAARARGEAQGPLRVVADQRSRPTYAEDLSGGLLALLQTGARGLVHLANDGEATWWELARLALDRAGFAEVAVEKIPAEAYPRPAPVPGYSVLDLGRARALGVRLRDWPAAVAAYLEAPFGPLAAEGLR